MGLIGLFLLAIGLSMDAFAVAVCKGLTMSAVTMRKALVVGLYFGLFQAGMPIIGYLLAMQFADYVVAFSPWIAFSLLSFLGIKMIFGSFKKETRLGVNTDRQCDNAETENGNSENTNTQTATSSLSPGKMLPLAFATSIDALAVGVSFAFLQANIVLTVLLIGVITFLMSMFGFKIGNLFGTRFKSNAEIFGGVILIGIGANILLQHLR